MKRAFRTLVLVTVISIGAALATAIPQEADVRDVKQVTLERTPCFGACPVYEVTIESDGTVRYKGIRFVEKIGDYEGRVSPYEFQKLVKAMDNLGYWKLDKEYTENITDQPSQDVSVVTDEGTRTVHNYGSKAPEEFWMIRTLIDGVLQNVKLQKVKA